MAEKTEEGKEKRCWARENTDDNFQSSLIGFPKTFPKEFIGTHEIVVDFKAGKVPKLTVNRHLQVGGDALHDPQLKDKFEFCDLIVAINDVQLMSRDQYHQEVAKLNKLNQPKTVKWTVKRVRRNSRIQNPADSTLIPPALEIQDGYGYFVCCLTLQPGETLGLNIKSFNSKVFVTSTDNSYNCSSHKTFVVGDAILSVENSPVSAVQDCSQKIKNALKSKMHALFIVERAEGPVALRQVRVALYTQRSREMDPRMSNDVIDICRAEMMRLKKQAADTNRKSPPRDLLNVDPVSEDDVEETEETTVTATRVQITKEAQEVQIGSNPLNPLLLQHVPQRSFLKGTNRKFGMMEK